MSRVSIVAVGVLILSLLTPAAVRFARDCRDRVYATERNVILRGNPGMIAQRLRIYIHSHGAYPNSDKKCSADVFSELMQWDGGASECMSVFAYPQGLNDHAILDSSFVYTTWQREIPPDICTQRSASGKPLLFAWHNELGAEAVRRRCGLTNVVVAITLDGGVLQLTPQDLRDVVDHTRRVLEQTKRLGRGDSVTSSHVTNASPVKEAGE